MHAAAKQTFIQRLCEAAAWCAGQNPLWTDVFRPPEIRADDGDWPPMASRAAMVAWVAGQRSRRLGTLTAGVALPMPTKDAGRLLAFDPDHSLFDGAAQVATHGYFDGYNTPPWATWLAYIEGAQIQGEWQPFSSYLLSWVPREGIPLVAQGIEVNPEQCLRWATDIAAPFIQQLRANNLLW